MSKLIKILSAVFLLTASISCEKEKPLPVPEFNRYNQDNAFHSEILGREVHYAILFPENYREEKDVRYPVVYMLQGYGESKVGGRDWSKWISKIKIEEALGLQPMIYVFPDCKNSYYSNSYDGKNMYMDMFVKELVPFVDNSFRTIADREHRAVMGYSMGGFGAMVLPMKNPDIFGISVPLSISVRTDEQYMNESQDGWNNQWGSIFGGKGQNGYGRITDYYKEHSPFYQFTEANRETLSRIKWFMHCGDDEEQILIANDNLHVLMRNNGYEHEFRIGDGGHSGDYWRNAASETLPWIAHQMNGGGEWTKITGTLPTSYAELEEDGTFASKGYKTAETKDGIAIYFAYKDIEAHILEKMMGIIGKVKSNVQYMILPCDISIKPLAEWIEEYKSKYEVGKELAKSHIIAFGEAGREAYGLQDEFSVFYFHDADLAEDEATITADASKWYYIEQTDDSENYKDMHALYHACMKAINGDIDHSNFQYRMRNGISDIEQTLLYAAKGIADNFQK